MNTISSQALAFALPLFLLLTHCGDTEPAEDNDGGSLQTGGGGAGATGGNGNGNGGTGGAVGGGGVGGSGGSIESDVITLVHESSGEQTVDALHAALAPDGTIYALWADSTNQGHQLKVSRSFDDGLTFDAPVGIETGSVEIATFEETQPKLGVSNNRVAVAFTNLSGDNVWVTHSDTAGSLNFQAPIAIGAGGVGAKNQFPAVAIGNNDEVWVTWARGEQQMTVLRMFAARESEGFVVTNITDETSGRPCVCCGVEMLGMSSGEMDVVFRGWDSPREQFVVQHPGTAGGSWTTVQASNSNWMFMGCPENGSGVAEIPGGGVRMAWTDPTSGASKIWLADSYDAGLSWQPQYLASDPFEGGHPGPLLAIESDGRTWLGWAPPFNGTPQVVSSPNGQNFSELMTLRVDEGELKRPTLVAGTNGAFGIGIVDSKQIWIVSLD